MQPTQNGKGSSLVTGLAWFSFGLGAAELIAPGILARAIGIRDKTKTRTILRGYGLREIAAGAGLLTQARPAGWVWGRIAGDAMDLSSLLSAMGSSRTNKTKAAAATAAVAGATVLDVICAQKLSRNLPYEIRVSSSVLINRPPGEVYRFWRHAENLPRFMEHLELVKTTGEKTSCWRIKAPAGISIEWDSEIVQDQPDSAIAWHSMEGSALENSGIVHFDNATGKPNATLVCLDLHYVPPGGAVGAQIAKLFGKLPVMAIKEDLRRLKQILETGEVMRSDASIHSKMHAARPALPQEQPALAL